MLQCSVCVCVCVCVCVLVIKRNVAQFCMNTVNPVLFEVYPDTSVEGHMDC